MLVRQLHVSEPENILLNKFTNVYVFGKLLNVKSKSFKNLTL